MKPRTPLPKLSKKKQAQLAASGVRVFSTITPKPKAKRKAKPKAERDEKFAREFHSEARRQWVESLPCVACGAGPCENHHITTGGTGRRAHYSLIVPLCFAHHREWHASGRHTFCAKYNIVAAVEAESTAREWLAEQSRRDTTH